MTSNKASWRDHTHRLAGVPDPPEPKARKLPCGHSTTAAPVSTGPSGKFYRCPEGCDLQKVQR